MLNIIKNYFHWLQQDNPTGEVARYPVQRDNYQSNIRGLFLVGDITGLPLLKFATRQGHEVIAQIAGELKRDENQALYDVAIVGAGAAGLAAALQAKAQGLKYIVLEAARTANTIVNFPKGKLIFAEPRQLNSPSELPIKEATKEETLDAWYRLIDRAQLNIEQGVKVENIEKQRDGNFDLTLNGRPALRARRVVLAIGKSGNARRLNVPGEDLAKVSHHLYSPLDYHEQHILVIGGGDSAVETAMALAESGNNVTLSYWKSAFTRLKSANALRIAEFEQAGRLKIIYNSRVKEIKESSVSLMIEAPHQREERLIKNDAVFKMIGQELPYPFLDRLGITIEHSWTMARFLLYSLSVLIFTLVYFGKHLNGSFVLQQPGEARFAEWTAPALIVTGMMTAILMIFLRVNREKYPRWQDKLAPVTVAATTIGISLFSLWYVSGRETFLLLGQNPGFWYGALYSAIVLIFGIRRIWKRRDRYITLQTLSLIGFQVVLLFLLPVMLPWLAEHGFVPAWLEAQAFPDKSYWRVFGFILAYPLFIYNVLTDQPSMFWLIVSAAQTFIIIPALIYFFGKGAYCGWICSCGGLAETLGDSYRTLAPHGERAKRYENIGQFVLAAALLLSAIWMIGHWTPLRATMIMGRTLAQLGESFHRWYGLIIDIGFAGTIGLGTYFFYSGRIWCRYGCPLAALMHIYTKFSKYRIFADKQRCISCGICTKNCHMGIDVMGYASQGRPMDDVECVRCAACITSCPMDVLSFGQLGKTPAVKLYQLGKR